MNKLTIHVGNKNEMNVAEGCVYLKADGTCTADGAHCTYPACDGHQRVCDTLPPPGEESPEDAGGDREVM